MGEGGEGGETERRGRRRPRPGERHRESVGVQAAKRERGERSQASLDAVCRSSLGGPVPALSREWLAGQQAARPSHPFRPARVAACRCATRPLSLSLKRNALPRPSPPLLFGGGGGQRGRGGREVSCRAGSARVLSCTPHREWADAGRASGRAGERRGGGVHARAASARGGGGRSGERLQHARAGSASPPLHGPLLCPLTCPTSRACGVLSWCGEVLKVKRRGEK